MNTTIAYLRNHWGEVYEFESSSDGTFTATARFGNHQALTADSADELLLLVWHHYPGKAAIPQSLSETGPDLDSGRPSSRLA